MIFSCDEDVGCGGLLLLLLLLLLFVVVVVVVVVLSVPPFLDLDEEVGLGTMAPPRLLVRTGKEPLRSCRCCCLPLEEDEDDVDFPEIFFSTPLRPGKAPKEFRLREF